MKFAFVAILQKILEIEFIHNGVRFCRFLNSHNGSGSCFSLETLCCCFFFFFFRIKQGSSAFSDHLHKNIGQRDIFQGKW